MNNGSITTNADSKFDRAVKIVSAVGVVAGIVFTGYQIRDAAQTEKSALLYQIQKDGREILKGVAGLEDYFECVHDSIECDGDVQKNARTGIRLIIQFYSSVNNQSKSGALEEKYWSVFSDELCRYVALPEVSEYWAEKKSGYSDSLNTEIEKCD